MSYFSRFCHVSLCVCLVLRSYSSMRLNSSGLWGRTRGFTVTRLVVKYTAYSAHEGGDICSNNPPFLCVCSSMAPLPTKTFSPENRMPAMQPIEERVTEHHKTRRKAKIHSQPKQALDWKQNYVLPLSGFFLFSFNSSLWWLVMFGFVKTHKILSSPFLLLLLLWKSLSPVALLCGESAGWTALHRGIQKALWTKRSLELYPMRYRRPHLPSLILLLPSSPVWALHLFWLVSQVRGILWPYAVFSAECSFGAIRKPVYSFDWIVPLLCISFSLSPSITHLPSLPAYPYPPPTPSHV